MTEHRHTWLIPRPNGKRKTLGTCTGCPAERVMYNSLEKDYGAWEKIWREPGSPYHLGTSMKGKGKIDSG
jgi:hypothetical protein